MWGICLCVGVSLCAWWWGEGGEKVVREGVFVIDVILASIESTYVYTCFVFLLTLYTDLQLSLINADLR